PLFGESDLNSTRHCIVIRNSEEAWRNISGFDESKAVHLCFHSERQFLSLPVAPLAPTRVSLDEFSRTIHESPAVYLVDKGRILLLVPLHGPLLRLRNHKHQNPAADW